MHFIPELDLAHVQLDVILGDPGADSRDERQIKRAK